MQIARKLEKFAKLILATSAARNCYAIFEMPEVKWKGLIPNSTQTFQQILQFAVKEKKIGELLFDSLGLDLLQ